MTLYAFSPEVPEDAPEPAVAEMRWGWEALGQALRIWRLIDPARAGSFERWYRAGIPEEGFEPPRWEGQALLGLAEGASALHDALHGVGALDPKGFLTPDWLERVEAALGPPEPGRTSTPLTRRNLAEERVYRIREVGGFLAEAARDGLAVIAN